MNLLHDKLIAEGYTKDNPPPYARWVYGWEHFEYTLEAIREMVWETPCGLLRKGKTMDGCGSVYKDGITYRPENNNLRIGCPYYDEKECAYRDSTFPDGSNCIAHRTERPWDYENSVEKLWDEWDEIQYAARRKAMGDGHCACMKWDRPKRRYVPRFWPQECINTKCQNKVCLITKQPRDLEKVNIFYDILKEEHRKEGLLEFHDKTLEKGVKVFERPVARTDAEMWLKMNIKRFRPKVDIEERSKVFQSETRDDYSFTLTPLNFRIEKRDTRDLRQDLQDIQAGIEVVHASDLAKQRKQAYRERKAERKEAKARKARNLRIENLRRIAFEGLNPEGEPVSESLQQWAKKQLERHGITTVEQVSLFEGVRNENRAN